MPAALRRALLLGALLAATAVQAAPVVQLSVDATDLDHRILQVRETLAVRPGPLTLYFPRWLPGTHSPVGDVSRVAGLKFSTAANEPLAWTRDTLDTHAFKLTVPPSTERLKIEFQYLSAVTKDSGRRVLTAEMMNLQWNDLLLYPAGAPARGIEAQATLKLPAGWAWAGALRAEAEGPDGVRFKPVSLETLVDSPLFAGRHLRRIEMDPAGTPRPVVLNLVADRSDLLKPGDPQIEAHRQLVRQADRLFGARHFAHYDFLLALSDTMGGIGLEHHESSENGVKPDYWERWDKRIGARELLPHEYVHSWNGKFRRPADLSTPDYNSVAMQNSLLWVYEGQTQFWGWVLMARSGLATVDQARQRLALNAASYQARAGRTWRNLQDTTNDPIVARGQAKDWRAWQRSAGDYYGESLLIWLDADSLIREKSGGQRSMDNFARAFFGVDDGQVGPRTYTFDEVVATLNRVQPHDWARFLRERLDSHGAAPLDGLARGGWKLVFTDQPSDETLGYEADEKVCDLTYSLGLEIAADGKLNSVHWGSPAFDAGLAPGLMLLAVNRIAYKPELLKSAITANVDGQAPIELLLRDGDLYRSVRIDWRGGLRYPRLAAIAGSEDRLGALLAPR